MEHLPELTCDTAGWRREWHRFLPADYRRQVGVPLRFERHADLEAASQRVIGYDRSGEACFYHHLYEVLAPVADDEDGDFLVDARAYARTVFAWRLGGEWLVCTRDHGAAGACRPEQTRYVRSAQRPR